MKRSDFKYSDVGWILPNRKRPFYYTSLWARDGLRYMLRKYTKKHKSVPTVTQLRGFYTQESEETQLLDEMIRRGLGEEKFKSV